MGREGRAKRKRTPQREVRDLGAAARPGIGCKRRPRETLGARQKKLHWNPTNFFPYSSINASKFSQIHVVIFLFTWKMFVYFSCSENHAQQIT